MPNYVPIRVYIQMVEHTCSMFMTLSCTNHSDACALFWTHDTIYNDEKISHYREQHPRLPEHMVVPNMCRNTVQFHAAASGPPADNKVLGSWNSGAATATKNQFGINNNSLIRYDVTGTTRSCNPPLFALHGVPRFHPCHFMWYNECFLSGMMESYIFIVGHHCK